MVTNSGVFVRRTSAKLGFTLIELLVVIAIIALLAAILFPAFARARENARRAACQSNLKQIGIGIAQYSQDYDERLPINQTNYSGYYGVLNYGDPGAPTSYWTAIYPYTKSAQIELCPSSTPYTASVGGLNPTANSNASYMANTMLLESDDATQNYVPQGRHIASIPNPSQIIEMQEEPQSFSYAAYGPDSIFNNAANANPMRYFYWHDNNGTGGPEVYSNVHFNGGNLLFADGHVKWRAIVSLQAFEFGLSTAPGSTTPSTDTIAVNPNTMTNYGGLF